MTRNEIIAHLGPHMRRPIRAFLADKRVSIETETAFWAAVYAKTPRVDHKEAVIIMGILEGSPLRVETVLSDTWRRPACGHSACSQHFIDTGETACVTADDDEVTP